MPARLPLRRRRLCARRAPRTRHCDVPPLVTTASDGDNGGWFRNTTASANFWGAFYEPLLARVGAGHAGGIRPAFIHEHLARHGAAGEVVVRPGAWNTGWHDGNGFTQWTGSAAQRGALARIGEVSARLHALDGAAGGLARQRLDEAFAHLLRAETSCYLYWGEAWVGRCHAELDQALALCALSPA